MQIAPTSNAPDSSPKKLRKNMINELQEIYADLEDRLEGLVED